MKSGKLDEELRRMSEIVDDLATDSLLLFNESFAATNEREGSEIARHIVSPLLEKRIKIFVSGKMQVRVYQIAPDAQSFSHLERGEQAMPTTEE